MRPDKPVEFRGRVRPALASTVQRGRIWAWVHRKSAHCLPLNRFSWDRRTAEERRRGDDLVALQFSFRSTARMLRRFGASGHFDDRGRVRENQFIQISRPTANVIPIGSRTAR